MGCLECLSRVDPSSMRFEDFTRNHHGIITCFHQRSSRNNHLLYWKGLWFVVLYDWTSSLLKVNEACQELFCKKSREFDSIPPTKAALEQHIRRAVLQGAHTWGQTLLCQSVLPNPADWGWQRQARRWSLYWTTLKQAKDTCYELIHCGCKIACRGRCKSMKANLVCTGLCKCGGNCQQQ